MKTLIFGDNTFASLVHQESLFQNRRVDGFIVETETHRSMKRKHGLPVYLIDDLVSGDVIINGTTFQNRKGPDFLRRIKKIVINHDCKWSGFNSLEATNNSIKVSATAQVWRNAIMDYYASVGEMSQIRPGVYVGHHAVIGRYCYLAPRCTFGSGASSGDNVFIGANSIVAPNVQLESNIVIAAGATVRKNVSSNSFVLPNGSVRKSDNPFRFI